MKNNTFAILAQNAPRELDDTLSALGFIPLRLPPSSRLSAPVCFHADMLIFPFENIIFCHESYLDTAKQALALVLDKGYTLKAVGGGYGTKYPDDVLLNIAVLGKSILIGKRTVSEEIYKLAEKQNYNIIRTSQGYVKCSSCIISENALITADESICAAAKSNGISVLKISKGFVSLPPYEYGFIGGASGTFGDCVYFVGDILSHPDGEAIVEFCAAHGKKAVALLNAPLTDIGGIIFL